MKLTFIGLGVMGYPMAGHLTQGGHQVTVYNRTAKKAEQWVEQHKGTMSDTPALAAKDADVVFVCVGNDDDVRKVIYGEDGALAKMTEGSILVDHTTASDSLARELATACTERGVSFIDAPVSGGQAGAENGALTIMCGGDQKDFDKVCPIIDCYAKKRVLIGGHGHGQSAKMVNQVCIAGLLQGLSEAIHLGQHSGLDMKKVFEAISQGAAQSWQMVNRSETMLENKYEFGFAVDWMIKDLSICLAASNNLDINLPITKIIKEKYDELNQKNRGRFDTSSLLTLLQDTHPSDKN